MTQSATPRLLVVDDDLSVIAAYRLVLEKDDDFKSAKDMFGLDALESELFGTRSTAKNEWRVMFVDQGLDAVKAVQWALDDGDPYTAIFLDVRMPPGIDGYETADRIRKLDANVHIVVVSGYSDYTYEDFLEVAGPEHRLTFLPKPVWPDQLRKVARILATEKSHRALLNPLRPAV